MKKSLSKFLIGFFAMGLCLSCNGKQNNLDEAKAYRPDIFVPLPGDGGGGGGGSSSSTVAEAIIINTYNSLNNNAKAHVTYAQFRNYYFSHSLTIIEVRNYYNNLYPEIDPTSIPNNPYNDTDWYYWRSYGDVDGVISNCTKGGNKAAGSGFVPMPCYSADDKNKTLNQANPVEFNIEPGNPGLNPRLPKYSEPYITVDYDDLQPGDIFWDALTGDNTPCNVVSHVGMVVNVHQPGKFTFNDGSVNNFTFVETIEAVATGVRYGFLDDYRIAHSGVKVIRPKCSTAKKTSAINFMYAQLGKKYGIIEELLAGDFISDRWYCTQLVYNAYYQAGYNLVDQAFLITYGVSPNRPMVAEMLFDSNRSTFIDFYDYGTDASPKVLSINQGVGYWDVTVRNDTGFILCMSYTPTKYFFSDIMENFRNPEEKMGCEYLWPTETRTIRIESNWLANTGLMYFAFNGMYHVTVLYHDLNVCVWNEPMVLTSLLYMYEDEYQIAKDYYGRYQVQITNCDGYTNKQYKIPYSPLMRQEEALYYNFDFDSYNQFIITTYHYDRASDCRGTMFFDILTDNNSLSSRNGYCLRTYTNGNEESDKTISFILDKDNNTYIKRVRQNVDYVRIRPVSNNGLYMEFKIYNLTNGPRPVRYCTRAIALYSNLNLENVSPYIATQQVPANGSKSVYILNRSGYNEVVAWAERGDYRENVTFGGYINFSLKTISLEFRVVG